MSEIGRSGSLPSPTKSALMPSAALTGKRKRSVDPLSQQLMQGWLLARWIGVMEMVLSFWTISAPKAFMQARVVSMSTELVGSCH